MIGGITDFYRSWRGVKISAELVLILKIDSQSTVNSRWNIFFPDFDLSFNIFVQWYFIVCLGFIACRSAIRLSAGILRKLGYNTRCRIAVAGSNSSRIDFKRISGGAMVRICS